MKSPGLALCSVLSMTSCVIHHFPSSLLKLLHSLVGFDISLFKSYFLFKFLALLCLPDNFASCISHWPCFCSLFPGCDCTPHLFCSSHHPPDISNLFLILSAATHSLRPHLVYYFSGADWFRYKSLFSCHVMCLCLHFLIHKLGSVHLTGFLRNIPNKLNF